jgi:O-antigen/teichoic acid export membrane protein
VGVDPADPPRAEASFDHAVHGLRWIGSARIFTQIVTLCLTALTARLLVPRDYGLVATSGLFTVFAEMLLDGGLVAVLLSRRELPRAVQGAAVTAVFLTGVLLSGVIIAVAPLAGDFFKSEPLVNLMRLASLQLTLGATAIVPTVRLLKGMRFRQIAVAQSSASLSQGVMTLALAYSGAAYWSLTIGTLLGICVRSLLLWLSVEHRPRPNAQLSLLLPLWRQGSKMVTQRVLWFVIGNLDTLLLGRFAGQSVLGSYSLAKNLAHSPLDQLAGIVNQVSIPVFAARVGDRAAQLRGLVLVVTLTSTLVCPFFWVGGVLSQLAFPLIFGPRWAAMVYPFMAFAAVLPARCIYALLDASVIGTGRFDTTLKNALTWAVVIVPLLLVGVRYGALGAALAWTLGFPVVLGVALWRIAAALEVSMRTFVLPMVRPAICAAVSAVLVHLLFVQPEGPLPPVLRLAAGIAVGAACYALLLRVLAPAQFAQGLKLIERLLRR